jgi:hypothetical protein
MAQKFQHYSALLALALPPPAYPSILDWRPFPGGDTLDTIITRYNDACYKHFAERLHWQPEDITQSVAGIQVVLHDLATVGEVQSEWAHITILLIDLDVRQKIEAEIPDIRIRMAKHVHPFFLTHVSQTSQASPLTNELRRLPIVPSEPEILPDQAALEAFLGQFRDKFVTALSSAIIAVPTPADTIDTIAMKAHYFYTKKLPDLAMHVRDMALIKDLSDDETATLARLAATQEFALACVAEQVRPSHRQRVVVDALRTPVGHLPVELPKRITPDLQPVELVTLSLTRPFRELAAEQRYTLMDLGIKGTAFTAVHRNQPRLWDTVRHLRGAVQATAFSAVLPVTETMRKSGRRTDAWGFETSFQPHHNAEFVGSGSASADYEPAYRYGHELGINERYRGWNWADLASEARRDWEAYRPGTWARFRDAIRSGWDTAGGNESISAL